MRIANKRFSFLLLFTRPTLMYYRSKKWNGTMVGTTDLCLAEEKKAE
ncbi:hypothetical protein [Fictibacillus barbaricus]|uniref:Uncharacterized protein n=1 Tax=Fictibacillus barbaricus TaxID=182136 RepID=A0ABU1TWU1_9BACL|nr:hypothetical protein [Fictibacillus barbaricus]MDR7071677.1 hypothetical protein [Fictibacillus barbaricus]